MPPTLDVPGHWEDSQEQRKGLVRSSRRYRCSVPNPSGMTSRTTALTTAQSLGRTEHGRSGSSAIPTTTASWVVQLDCYIWGRRTYEVFHGAAPRIFQQHQRSPATEILPITRFGSIQARAFSVRPNLRLWSQARAPKTPPAPGASDSGFPNRYLPVQNLFR